MTFDAMEALTQQIANDVDQHDYAGLAVVSWGPDLRRRLVGVGVRGDVVRAETVLHCQNGAKVFVFIDSRRLVVADSALPAAGVCAQAVGRYAVVHVNPDTPAPRCQTVRADQQLEVVNTSDAFNQIGSAVTIDWPPYPPGR